MRYLIQASFKSEVPGRKKYLYKIFKLWFLPTEEKNGFITFTSIPASCYPNILFIVGHNYNVYDYLVRNTVAETTIVAITCVGSYFYKELNISDKAIYVPFQNQYNLVDLLSGQEFGFDFNLTESEILLYNSPNNLSIEERLAKTFRSLSSRRAIKT